MNPVSSVERTSQTIEKYIFSLTMSVSGSRAPAVLAGAVGTPPLLLQQGVVCRELVLDDAGDVVLEETRLRAGALQLQLAIFLALSGQSPDTVKWGGDGGVGGGVWRVHGAASPSPPCR